MPESEESVRFEVLGPLCAWRGEDELALGPAKQRAVLGVLLIAAGTPRRAEQIVDAVWGDEPPVNGPNVVQKYIAGLRRILEPDRAPRSPGVLLERTDAGYRLQVPPGCLDAEVFRLQVRRAESRRASAGPAEAAARLRQALGLWRGEALAGLSGPAFDAERRRLTEVRAGALESWVDCELSLGHHGQVLPELVKLVTEYPIREQLRCQLMLALYRAGRQADALAAFRDARDMLADEYGVEPGEQLQEMHRRILRSDPGLLTDERSTTGRRGQLPEDPAPREPSPSEAAPEPSVAGRPSSVSGRAWADAPPVTPPWAGGAPTSPLSARPPSPVPPGPMSTPWEPVTTPPLWQYPPGPVFAPSAPTASPYYAPYSPMPVPSMTPPVPGPPRRRRVWVTVLVATVIPLVTFGFGSFAVIVYFAERRRSWWLRLASAGYLGLIIGICAAMMANPDSSPDAPLLVSDMIGMSCWAVMWFGGTTHAALLALLSDRQPSSR